MARNNPLPSVLPLPGVRVTLSLTADANIQQITQVYNNGSGVTPGLIDLQNFAVAWNIANLAPLQAVLPTDATFTTLTIAEVWGGLTPTYVSTYAPAVTGTQTGGHMPLETAVAVIWRTSLKGQHGRGRLQFPDVPASFVTPLTNPNAITAGALALYAAAVAALQATLTTSMGPWVPVVAVRPVAPATLVTRAAVILTSNINRNLGTQRRRKFGRGI